MTPELWMLAVVSIVSPMLTQLVKRFFPDAGAELATLINQGIATVLTLIAWATLGGADPSKLGEWFLWAQAGGGAGTSAYNALKALARRAVRGG